jgi:hypothetical protein
MFASETPGGRIIGVKPSVMVKIERAKARTAVNFLRLAGISFVFVFIFAVPRTASAMWKGYDGTVNEPAVTVNMRAGESKTIILTYKNTGEKHWIRGSDEGNVNLYLAESNGSPLRHSSWADWETAGRIRDASVPPGGSTTVSLTLYASKSGTFVDTFRLAASEVAWMRGAETKVTAVVSESGSVSAPASAPSSSASPASDPSSSETQTYSGVLLLKSTKSLTLKGDDEATVTYGFKNTGSSVWNVRSLRLSAVHSAAAGAENSWVYHDTWEDAIEAVTVPAPTKPGEIGFLTFTLTAPPKRGSYTARFALFADGRQVQGAYVDIPVTVTSDGEYRLSPPITPPAVSSPGNIPIAPDYTGTEPVIRVGLFRTTDDQMKIKGYAGPYRAFQGDKSICSFQKDEEATVRFDRTNGVYKLTGPGCMSQSTEPYRFQRTDGEWEPLEMSDFSRPVSWYPGANDNTFRGILELRYAADDPDHDVWTVNELPMELYLRGIAETSDSSPLEYQKALLTAARTYGYYHWTRGTKHETRGFHIDGKYDQVYRGYGAEARSPRIVRAVTETRGQIVTYNGALAITPYFSRSDGRTRDWDEVWAGGENYPWLKSVPVPQDEGQTLWGHGVGMSATGALGMAEEGQNYVQILKHFYTGVEIMKYY